MLKLEAGYWGSNVSTLGVTEYRGFHVCVDDGDMGMPVEGGTCRVGLYVGSDVDNGIMGECTYTEVGIAKEVDKMIDLLYIGLDYANWERVCFNSMSWEFQQGKEIDDERKIKRDKAGKWLITADNGDWIAYGNEEDCDLLEEVYQAWLVKENSNART